METQTLTFKGDKKLKTAMLREIKKHEKADAILQGTYGRENGSWKGCAVACSLRSLAIVKKEPLVTEYNQHSRYETDLGISETIARLEDRLFEGMEKKDAKTFPRKFIEAVPVGADLSLVPAKFMVFILNDTLKHKQVQKNKEVVRAVQGVIQFWEDVINGKYVGKNEELKSAARSAAESAAESAAWSAAESAARSAARSAAESAESAARSAAWSAAFKRFADHLLKLLKEAPVVRRRK